MLRRRPPAPDPDPIALTRRALAARRAKRIPNVWIDRNSWRIGETFMGDREAAELLAAADELWALAAAGRLRVEIEPTFESHWIVDGRAIATTPAAIAAIVAAHRKPAAAPVPSRALEALAC